MFALWLPFISIHTVCLVLFYVLISSIHVSSCDVLNPLQWRHNGRDSVSNHQLHDWIVYSTVYSDADQRKHESSVSLAFVRGIHRGPVNSPHKWPVTRKMFPFDDVIMLYSPGLLHCPLAMDQLCGGLTFYLSLSCYHEQVVQLTVDLPLICNTITLV